MAVQMWRINLASADFPGLSRLKSIGDGVRALFTYLVGFVGLFAPDQP
jgi:hypothetical protein